MHSSKAIEQQPSIQIQQLEPEVTTTYQSCIFHAQKIFNFFMLLNFFTWLIQFLTSFFFLYIFPFLPYFVFFNSSFEWMLILPRQFCCASSSDKAETQPCLLSWCNGRCSTVNIHSEAFAHIQPLNTFCGGLGCGTGAMEKICLFF